MAYGIGRQNREEAKAFAARLKSVGENQEALRSELREVHELLRRTAAASGATPTLPPRREIAVSVEGAPFKGDANAPVTLVEFTDYECGFCARHVRDTLPELEREYIAPGKLKYVFRNFPLESIHKKAFKAHEAAHCAGEQGKFWQMHDRLFANQTALGPDQLVPHAEAVGLDVAIFQSCLNGGLQTATVRKDLAEGRQAGLTATPAFFLGRTNAGSTTILATTTIRGAKAYPAFKEAIDALLASKPES